MRPTLRRLALVVPLVLIPSLGSAQRSATDSVLAIDSAWARSYATNDTALALRVMSEDFFMTATSGETKDRAQELGDVRAVPGMKVAYFRTEDVRTRLYGSAAVLTGVAAWQVEQDGRGSSIRRRYTAVYARGGPLGWRLVALHMGRAPS